MILLTMIVLHSVGALGLADPASGIVRAHSNAITCVDAMGDTVLSTGGCWNYAVFG